MGIGADDVALEEKEAPLAVVGPCLRTLEVGRGRVREFQGMEAAGQLFAPGREWPGGWGAWSAVWVRGG